MVQLSLSPKAMAQADQRLNVTATWSAYAAPGAESHASPNGRVILGTESMDASAHAQMLHINAPRNPRNLADVRGPILVEVTANAASRAGNAANQLTCDDFNGQNDEVTQAPAPLRCFLASERPNSANSSNSIPAGRIADTYAIYSMLLPGTSADKIANTPTQNWQLADTTINITDMNPAVPPNGALKPPPDNAQAFTEAVRDFNARKYQRFHLDANSFHPPRVLPLIDDHQVSNLRQSGDPHAGVVFFSAVYFNANQTAALVYVNDWCANMCSAGQWVYLEKQNGQWVRRSGIVS